MANLQAEAGIIALKLSKIEILGACHYSLKMPLSELQSIEFVANPWTANTMRGLRAPGTGIPFVIMLGTLRNFKGWKAFCAVYKKGPAIVLKWKSGSFNEWIVSANEEVFNLLQKSVAN
jgi:hypothetical protein